MLTHSLHSYNYHFILCLIISTLVTPTAEAFLSPKQKTKIRQEQRARSESPDEEYLYYNKIKCGLLGSFGLMIGIPAIVIGLIVPGTLDKIIFGIGGPILTVSGIYFLEHFFRSGPGAVINQWGIRIRDYGLIIWEEIAFIDIPTDTNNEFIYFILTDETTLTVSCAALMGSYAGVIKKIQRFRDIRLEQSSYFNNRYVLQEKSYI